MQGKHGTQNNKKKKISTKYNIMKRILMTPQSTPRESLYLETGIVDISTQLEINRINKYANMIKQDENLYTGLIQESEPTKWLQHTKKIIDKYNITHEDLNIRNKTKRKHTIKNKITQKFRERMRTNGKEKSKVQHHISRQIHYPDKKPRYISNLNRQETSLIFRARTRMLDMKENYKNKYTDQKCRKCQNAPESQKHILEECEVIHQTDLTKAREYEIHSNSLTLNKKAAKNILIILDKLKK